MSSQTYSRFYTRAVRLIVDLLLGVMVSTAAHAQPAALDAELLAIQQSWAQANYQITDAEQKKNAFEALSKRAAAFSKQYPDRAEPLVWEGIVLSTYAGAKGGLGALGLAKQARQKLEAALKLNPNALEGSAYTSLGTLYHKVPGFPLGFGDDKKAREYLEHALQLNPTGIDPNYFYGEFLFDKGEYAQAAQHLQKALQAEPRTNRETADQGRRKEVTALLVRVKEKMS